MLDLFQCQGPSELSYSHVSRQEVVSDDPGSGNNDVDHAVIYIRD